MKQSISVLITAVTCGLISCSPIKKSLVIDREAPVYEVAVRQVKDGMKADFEAARASFIKILISQEGVSNDREFQSFYALPVPDEREVFVGMTEYASYETPGDVQSTWAVVSKFLDFKKTMDLKGYVFVQPIEGGDFDLGQLAKKPGQVLEVAIRKVKAGQEVSFEANRISFVNWLGEQQGVVGSWEFKVVGGNDIEGLTVGMSVYESQEAFQAIAGRVQSLPQAGQYFSTFEPVALQYAISIK